MVPPGAAQNHNQNHRPRGTTRHNMVVQRIIHVLYLTSCCPVLASRLLPSHKALIATLTVVSSRNPVLVTASHELSRTVGLAPTDAGQVEGVVRGPGGGHVHCCQHPRC